MALALEQAHKAFLLGEVPVGAVIVMDDKVVSSTHNLRETLNCSTAHAELLAIEEVCKKLCTWRLSDCTLYVTLEPCPMCAGAIINSRIKRVVFGAFDPKAGSCGSVTDLFELDYNHKPQVSIGVLSKECGEILSEFFRKIRKKNLKSELL